MNKIRTLFTITLALSLSTNSNSSTNVGGWDVNPLRDGISTVYEATRQTVINGANAVKKASVRITPTVTQVAKQIKNTGGGAVVVYAVTALLGAGVDWVLDPANNQIKYTTYPTGQYYWSTYNTGMTNTTFEAAATEHMPNVLRTRPDVTKFRKGSACTLFGTNGFTAVYMNSNDVVRLNVCIVQQGLQTPENKTLPLTTVAAQILNDATSNTDESRKSAALNFVHATSDTAIAAPDAFPNEQDRPVPYIAPDFDATATTQSAAPAKSTSTSTSTTTKSDGTVDTSTEIAETELPAFCGWVPVVCEAAQYVVTQPKIWAQTIEKEYTEIKSWAFSEQTIEQTTEVEVIDTPVEIPETQYLSWGSYCPFTNRNDDISLNGESSVISSDLSSWCQMASDIRPFVIMAGALAALFIASGVSMRTE